MLHLACISNDASFELDEKLSQVDQLRLLRADGDRRQDRPASSASSTARRARSTACQRLAGRDRRSSAGAADALQQVQGHVRAAAVEAPGRRLHLRHHPPGDGLRLQPAHAARSLGQHPDQSCGQQGQDHRVRRRRRCGRTCTSQDMVRRLRADARRRRTRRSHGETFNIGFQNHVDRGDRRDGASAWSRRNCRRRGDDRDRHHAVERHALLSRQFGQDPARPRLPAASARSRTPCAICVAAFKQPASCRTASTTTGTTTSAP